MNNQLRGIYSPDYYYNGQPIMPQPSTEEPHYFSPLAQHPYDDHYSQYSQSPIDLNQPSKIQAEAWSNVIKLHDQVLIKATKIGLDDVGMPDYEKCENMYIRSLKAQNSLIRKAISLAAKICHVASRVFKFAAIAFAASAVFHSIFGPFVLPQVASHFIAAIFLNVVSKGLQGISNLFDKAAMGWAKTYFSDEDKSQIENLKKWDKIAVLINMEVKPGIQQVFQATTDAINIDAKFPKLSHRYEWNEVAIAAFGTFDAKIKAYAKVMEMLNTGTNPYLLKRIMAS